MKPAADSPRDESFETAAGYKRQGEKSTTLPFGTTDRARQIESSLGVR